MKWRQYWWGTADHIRAGNHNLIKTTDAGIVWSDCVTAWTNTENLMLIIDRSWSLWSNLEKTSPPDKCIEHYCEYYCVTVWSQKWSLCSVQPLCHYLCFNDITFKPSCLSSLWTPQNPRKRKKDITGNWDLSQHDRAVSEWHQLEESNPI